MVTRLRLPFTLGPVLAVVVLTVAACSSSGGGRAAAPANTTAGPQNAVTTTAAPTGAGTARWVPALDTAWQWELDHPLNLSRATDLGTGVRDYLGRDAPNPTMYDIDGFDNPALTIAALHRRGDRAVCYVEVGALESYRPDTGAFPRSVIGRSVPDYPQERYLDIRSPVVLRLVEARITMCAAKGFDAVEPDIDDSYTDSTGFALTEAEQVTFDRTLAGFAHRRGMSMALKNGDDSTFAASMEPYVDFVIDEQCFQYRTCDSFSPFVRSGKAVFEVEYQGSTAAFCPDANRRNFNAGRFDLALDGPRHPCR